jgi:hypothetical protein
MAGETTMVCKSTRSQHILQLTSLQLTSCCWRYNTAYLRRHSSKPCAYDHGAEQNGYGEQSIRRLTTVPGRSWQAHGYEADTLITYVYADTDPAYYHNLLYFIEHGIRADDGCNYAIIIQVRANNALAYVMPSSSGSYTGAYAYARYVT